MLSSSTRRQEPCFNKFEAVLELKDQGPLQWKSMQYGGWSTKEKESQKESTSQKVKEKVKAKESQRVKVKESRQTQGVNKDIKVFKDLDQKEKESMPPTTHRIHNINVGPVAEQVILQGIVGQTHIDHSPTTIAFLQSWRN